jgi:hypothetical protein
MTHDRTSLKNAATREVAAERVGSMFGVPVRFFAVRADDSGRIVTQFAVSETRGLDGSPAQDSDQAIRFTARFDDSCHNGAETFAMTCALLGPVLRTRFSWRRPDIGGGADHDAIAAAFPEVRGLLRWHLCSTDGPMHYIANTLYLAGDRDCYGLRAGESRQIIGRNGPAWRLRVLTDDGTESDLPQAYSSDTQDGPEPPPSPGRLVWRPWCRIGKGKARDLDAARRAACWPDAADADLMAEPAALKAALEARLPSLLAEFERDMRAAGFILPGEFEA